MKIYEEKEAIDEEDNETTEDNEQTLFPEKEMMKKIIKNGETSVIEIDNGRDTELAVEDAVGKDELEKLKTLLKEKDKIIVEKEETILEKDIELTTLKDEVESLAKNNESKAEEMEILIECKLFGKRNLSN